MNERRILKELSARKPLGTVEPTQIICITPLPCEKKAANVRNEAVKSIKINDNESVAYRYLQSKEGEGVTFLQFNGAFVGFLFFSAISVWLCRELNNDKHEMLLDVIYGCLLLGLLILEGTLFVSGLANVVNMFRYKETKEGCEEWLKNKIGEQKFFNVSQYSYSQYKSLYKSKSDKLQGIFHSSGLRGL